MIYLVASIVFGFVGLGVAVVGYRAENFGVHAFGACMMVISLYAVVAIGCSRLIATPSPW